MDGLHAIAFSKPNLFNLVRLTKAQIRTYKFIEMYELCSSLDVSSNLNISIESANVSLTDLYDKGYLIRERSINTATGYARHLYRVKPDLDQFSLSAIKKPKLFKKIMLTNAQRCDIQHVINACQIDSYCTASILAKWSETTINNANVRLKTLVKKGYLRRKRFYGDTQYCYWIK